MYIDELRGTSVKKNASYQYNTGGAHKPRISTGTKNQTLEPQQRSGKRDRAIWHLGDSSLHWRTIGGCPASTDSLYVTGVK